MPFTVTVSKEGYQTTTHEIRNPWSREGTTVGVVGNFFLGGAIGIGVDAATGANRDLTPNPLVVLLEAAPGQVAEEAAQPAATEPAEAPLAQRLNSMSHASTPHEARFQNSSAKVRPNEARHHSS